MNIGPTTWVNHFGVEFPAGTHRLFAALTIAKKWRLLEARGDEIKGDPGDCLEEAIRALLPSVKMSPWTLEMIHDFTLHDYYAMIGCGACGKSFFMGAASLCYWLPDPYTTTVIVGSSTLKDLASRAWSPILKLFTELKNNPYFEIPGKSLSNIYAIVNEKDSDIAASMTSLAGVQGRALDEGRVYGTHNEHVMLVVDELGLINDIESLKTALSNIRIGTKTFKFCSAANPNPWTSPQSCFYVPPKGVTVDAQTGSWTSDMGYFVRHFNGYRSPVVLDPSLKSEFNFLMSQDDIDSNLALCGGDPFHPRMQKMVVGFPLASGNTVPTVLDPVVAAANKVTAPPDPPSFGSRRSLGLASGVDPSWTSSGDQAIYAGCHVFEQDGKPILDFSGRVSRIPITTESPHPVTRQLRDGVISRIRQDNGPSLDRMYIDSSGNQGLADAVDIFMGPGCGHINNSARASDRPLRNLDPRPAKEHVRDRGTEGWMVLAEFCAAGMVKGLPQEALDGLIQRRFATRPNSQDPAVPLRLEAKEEYSRRNRGKSPDFTDACALAALAVKERVGVMPYGAAPPPVPEALFPEFLQAPAQDFEDEAGGAFEPDFGNIGAY